MITLFNDNAKDRMFASYLTCIYFICTMITCIYLVN